MDYVVYERATGRIDSWGICPAHMLRLYESDTMGAVGTAGIPTDDHANWWVKEGIPTRRARLPISISKAVIQADDVDEAVLTGFPEGCTVTVAGTDYVLTGGELRLTSPMPATYELACSTWPYLAWETSIEAIA